MPLLGPESLRIPMRPRITSDDMFFLRQAVRHGAGISVLSSFLAEADVRAGTLVRVLPRWHVPTGSIWMVVPGGGPSPRRLEVFRAHVVEGLAAATLRPSPPA
jgi:DNA-binding transcriptional LysR family regulator